MKKCLEDIWAWVKETKKIQSAPNDEEKKKTLSEFCKQSKSNYDFFNGISLRFPSHAAKNAAYTILFPDNCRKQNTFSMTSIMNVIGRAIDRADKPMTVILDTSLTLLSDIALFYIYEQLDSAVYGGVYYQLNKCIVLDAMRFKPDSVCFGSLLEEVTEKIRIGINNEPYTIIWTIAMLNYRTHSYEDAIEFLEKYLEKGTDDSKYAEKKIRATIYMGYCYEKKGALAHSYREKQESFDNAIKKFEDLLKELEAQPNLSEKDKEYVIELHHGLGHFYNELAVFASPNQRDPINHTKKTLYLMRARDNMRQAVNAKADYCSCYGSLFHEYGDLERALLIFDTSFEDSKINENEELAQEMTFYRAYTKSALSEQPQDHFEKEANDDFGKFEAYCSRTYNTDGISHAILFRIRNRMREIPVYQLKTNDRKRTFELVAEWKKDLQYNSLSEYASEEIKKEYLKTNVILDIFAALNASDSFDWRAQDLFYHLRHFVSLMDDDSLRIEYADQGERTCALNRIRFGRLWFWCIGGDDLKETIQKEELFFKSNNIPLYKDNIKEKFLFPVQDTENAHRSIVQSGKPDMILIIPPEKQDSGFEKELNDIQMAITNSGATIESCFLFANRNHTKYPTVEATPLRCAQYSDSLESVLQFAYCLRAIEVLKKELLQPIPLFSLAPTHFSEAYNFQLGDETDLLPELLDYSFDYASNIRGFLRLVDEKYKSKWLGREKVQNTRDALGSLCCKDNGFFAACFPQPEDGPIYQNNYISYYIKDKTKFGNLVPFGTKADDVFTTKALPDYSAQFFALESLIREREIPCTDNEKRGVECIWCTNSDLAGKDLLSTTSLELLKSIFGPNYKSPQLSYPIKCILRSVIDQGTKKKYIYLILAEKEEVLRLSRDHDYQEQQGKDEKIKVINEGNECLRILHLSDFHYKSTANGTDAQNRETYLRRLKEKLRDISEKQKINYICFTGDIAHSGISADYNGAIDHIREIRDYFNIDPNHLLICPGNHDLDLNKFSEKHPTTQKEANKRLNLEKLDEISQYFSAFSDFCKTISSAEYLIDNKSSYLLGVKCFENLTVICVNTAWYSMDPKTIKSKKPWIGDGFINTISNQISKRANVPVLTIMHHPVSEWEPRERCFYSGSTNVWNNLAKITNYILCGHTHETGALAETTENASILQGGCLYENKERNYENSFYIYSIPLNDSGKKVHSDKYMYINDEWRYQGK